MNTPFWDHLLSATAAIDALDDAEQPLPQLIAHLESIDVLYHRAFDPADDYEEYIAAALCHAIGKILSRE